MHLKKEFRKRLSKLDAEIYNVLIADCFGEAEKLGNLFPCFFSVLSLLWCNDFRNFLKK